MPPAATLRLALTLSQFFGRCLSHIEDTDLEMQGFAGEGVIEVKDCLILV